MSILKIIKSIGIYALIFLIVKVFLMWWLDRYDDWPTLVPLIEGTCSIAAAMSYLEENAETYAERKMTVLVAGLIVIGYWLFDIYDTIKEVKVSGVEMIFLLAMPLRDDVINILVVLGFMKFGSSQE